MRKLEASEKPGVSAPSAHTRKVLLVFTSSGIGGAERSLTRMAAYPQPNVIYRLLTLGGEGDWSVWAQGLEADIQVFDVFGRTKHRAGELVRCLSACREFQPDIVYVVGLKAAILLRLLLRPLVSGRFVHAIRSSFPLGSDMRRKFAIPERLLHRLTDHYIVNSASGAADLVHMSRVPRQKVTVIYNGLPPIDPIREPIGLRPPRVVIVANITGKKGHIEFLPVIRALRERVVGLQVWFVGRNEIGSALHEKIAQLGIDDVVSVMGFVEHPEDALRSSRVVALPTLEVEGCPTSIIEAMAMGLPVVAYAVGGIPEIIESGVNGILVERGDEEAFASALAMLLTDEVANRKLGEAAQATALAKFSLEACAEQHARLWRRLSPVHNSPQA